MNLYNCHINPIELKIVKICDQGQNQYAGHDMNNSL